MIKQIYKLSEGELNKNIRKLTLCICYPSAAHLVSFYAYQGNIGSSHADTSCQNSKIPFSFGNMIYF